MVTAQGQRVSAPVQLPPVVVEGEYEMSKVEKQ